MASIYRVVVFSTAFRYTEIDLSDVSLDLTFPSVR